MPGNLHSSRLSLNSKVQKWGGRWHWFYAVPSTFIKENGTSGMIYAIRSQTVAAKTAHGTSTDGQKSVVVTVNGPTRRDHK